jgi:hypothetical protein
VTAPKIKSVDYHRNGVGGKGFYVAIVEDLFGDGGSEGDFLVITFPTQDYDGSETEVSDYRYTAAFKMDLLANGEIRFGVNSWRGDRASAAVGDQMITQFDVESDARIASFAAETKAKREARTTVTESDEPAIM